MRRKMIALFMILAILVTFPPAVAADEITVTPTIEEIISDYHLTSFSTETSNTTNSNATWSQWNRNSTSPEQETVAALTNAGYDAYHMTPDNYDLLEAELSTDFSSIGIDPNGEYIIAISGADQSTFGFPSSYTTFGSNPEHCAVSQHFVDAVHI